MNATKTRRLTRDYLAAVDRATMYSMLASGEFGNTIPQFMSLDAWESSPDASRYHSWGVRTLKPGGPCELYVPSAEVPRTVKMFESWGNKCNISCMIDEVCTVTLWAEIFDSDGGLVVYGIEYPPRGLSWRAAMPYKGMSWYGLTAANILKKHLNQNSLDDLSILRSKYLGHVVELSATEECFGTTPLRNGVVWEVRSY